MATIELQVQGMDCGGCEESVQKALGALAGVTSVNADHASGRVVVGTDGELAREALRAAVEDAGYDLVG